MKKNNLLKWVNVIAFGILLLGGVNWLFIGLFQIDLFGGIFGGYDSPVSRVFYTIFGLAALALIVTIIVSAYWKPRPKTKAATAS